MGTFFLPKFGNVSTSFLGFIYEGGVFTVMTEASVGPAYRGHAGQLEWKYELDSGGSPESGDVGVLGNEVV